MKKENNTNIRKGNKENEEEKKNSYEDRRGKIERQR
jgi:hypothetical protein